MAQLTMSGIITRICIDLQARFAAADHTHSNYAASSHAHGSIASDGRITSDTAVGSGDKLVITDSSASHAVKRSSVAFGTSTTTFLRNDGTWAVAGGLPAVTASDNGKVLRVVNGQWAADSLPSASGVSF